MEVVSGPISLTNAETFAIVRRNRDVRHGKGLLPFGIHARQICVQSHNNPSQSKRQQDRCDFSQHHRVPLCEVQVLFYLKKRCGLSGACSVYSPMSCDSANGLLFGTPGTIEHVRSIMVELERRDSFENTTERRIASALTALSRVYPQLQLSPLEFLELVTLKPRSLVRVATVMRDLESRLGELDCRALLGDVVRIMNEG